MESLSAEKGNDFKRYSTVDGLSENYVNCIFQDKHGFIWIGTNDGLNKFDGYSFKIFRQDFDNDLGIQSNLIRTISEDNSGNLWIGTTDAGLIRFNIETEKFTHFQDPDLSNSPSSLNSVNKILINDSIIWYVNSNSIGLLIIKKGNEVPKHKRLAYADNSSRIIRSLVQDNSGNIWLGTASEIVNLNYNAKKDSILLKKYYIPYQNYVIDMVAYKDGLIISYFDNIQYFTKNRDGSSNFKKLADYFMNNLYVSSKQYVYGVESSGLSLIEIDYGKVEIIRKTSIQSEKLRNTVFNNVYQDHSGLVWLGTNGQGVNVYNPKKKKFRHVLPSHSNNKTSAINVRSFFEDSNGDFWIGTTQNGVNYISVSNPVNYNSQLQIDIKEDTFDDNAVFCFAEQGLPSGRRQLWLGSGYPIKLLSIPLNNSFKGDKLNYQKYDVNGSTMSLCVDSENNLWIGSYAQGITKFEFEGDHIIKERRYLPEQNTTLPSNIIRSIVEDKEGNLWFGTSNGLAKLIKTERNNPIPKFITYKYNKHDTSSISHNYILPIFESESGNIWIGTMGGGLNRLIKGSITSNDQFSRITTKDGLPNNIIKDIQEDKEGNLWISTNKGLSKFNPLNLECKNYDIHDGLQDSEFLELSGIKRKSGELLFGGVNGFNAFFPHEIEDDTTKTIIAITDFQLSYNTVPVGKKINNRILLTKTITNTNELILKHTENSFALTFAALHFIAPEKNQYEYKLEGFNEEWIRVSYKNRIAQYTSLPFGNYVFKVRGSNNDGVWNDNPTELEIRILPPFLLRWWAFISYLILLAGIFLFLFKYSIIRNNQKNELLMERLEKEKMKGLTQMKLRFFTNISHEFRTPLTVIASYLDNIIPSWKIMSEEKVDEDFSIISRNINVLLKLVNQLLDFRKFEQGKMKLELVNKDIIQFIKSTVELFRVLADEKNISLKFISGSKEVELFFDPDKMEKILNNLFSNAIKYTQRNGNIVVSIKELDDSVIIEIKDNGIGIPRKLQGQIFDRFYQARKTTGTSMAGSGIGLSFTKELIEMHKGSIEFESKEWVGSSFFLKFLKGNQHFSFESENLETEDSEISYFNSDMEVANNEPLKPMLNGEMLEKKILIVEDNIDLRNFLSGKLGEYFSTEMAENGKIGLEKCLTIQPDLVISDIMMPVMDGYELCNSVKNNTLTSHIPVILLTAKTSSESEVQGFNEGADAYVSKPFKLEVLLARITAIIQSREKLWQKIKVNPEINLTEVKYTAKDEKFLEKIISIIEHNMSNPDFTVEQLAEEYKISHITLKKKLKALTGKTTVQFVRWIRLKRAAQLIKSGSYQISEVTFDVGYTDLQHFRQHFKKEFSLTPSEFKKSVANSMK